MESEVTIKATYEEMNAFFENDELCLVKYFKSNNNGTFKAIIRHPELSKPLRGKFTIKAFKNAVERGKLN